MADIMSAYLVTASATAFVVIPIFLQLSKKCVKEKIGALAYDCGFRSPSVFAAFRKFAGRTPSDYLKSLSRT